MFKGQETFAIENDCVKRYNIHSEEKFVLAKKIKVAKNLKCVLVILTVSCLSFDDGSHNFC